MNMTRILTGTVSSLLLLVVMSGHSIAAGNNYSSDFDVRPIMAMLEQNRFLDAIDELHYELDADPDNADILSLLGYSYRKVQNYTDAMTFYEWALHAEPEHLGANEYLGELYLETGRLDKAEQQLQVLNQLCSTNCDEYQTLKRPSHRINNWLVSSHFHD